jgi:hypothetical protein
MILLVINIQQYKNIYRKANYISDSTAYSVITDEIIKPLWTDLKQIVKEHQNLLDLTEGISYIIFKNKALDAIILNDLRIDYHGFDDLKPTKKTKLANDYFDRITSKNLYGVV